MADFDVAINLAQPVTGLCSKGVDVIFGVDVLAVKFGQCELAGEGLAFFLKDLIVLPEYQRLGTGRTLLSHVENYIRSQLKEGWTARFQLVSAREKEGFYISCGYTQHPNKQSGAGFTKMITR